MTRTVDHDLTYLLDREVKNLRDQVSEFADEFTALTDEQLEDVIGTQNEIAEAAEYRADAATAELRLRRLAKIVTS